MVNVAPSVGTLLRNAEKAAGQKPIYPKSEFMADMDEDAAKAIYQIAGGLTAVGIPAEKALKFAEQVADIFATDLDFMQKAFRAGGWDRYQIGESATSSPLNKLGRGEMGQAFNDGTIEVDPNLKGEEREKTIAHEEKHARDMESGRLDYDSSSITYMGVKYPRKDGKIQYKGEWKREGDKSFPWEQAAYKAETPLKQTGHGPKEGTSEWEKAVQEGKQFNKDWYSNPVAAELFKEQAPRFKGGASDRFKTIDETHVAEGPASGAVAEYWRSSFPEEGGHKHNIEINPEGPGVSPELVAHETTHAAGFDYDLGKVAKGILGESKRKDAYGRYLNNPDEQYANLQELRHVLGLKPDQRDLTPAQLEKLAEEKGNDDVKAYIKNFGAENVAKAHNKVAAVDKSKNKLDNLRSLYSNFDNSIVT